MNLNYAVSTSPKYRDYHDTATRDFEFNQCVSNRIFDVGPLTQKYTIFGPNMNGYDKTMSTCPVDSCQPITRNNNSTMSTSFMNMKHSQQMESLMENPNVNQTSINTLEAQQQSDIRQLADAIQAKNANKYKELKYMSPEQLNNNYGQFDRSNKQITDYNADVYKQTSLRFNTTEHKMRSLNNEIADRHNAILNQSNGTGIQSYRSQCGSTLSEAYGM